MAEQDTEVVEVDHKQRLLDKAKEIEEGRSEEREDPPEIAVDDDGASEDDGDPEEHAEEQLDEPRPPRAERRVNRFTEANRRAEETQRALEEERARRFAAEAQIQALRAPPEPPQSVEQRRASVEAEYRQDLEALQRARMDLQEVVRANSDNFTEEVRKRVLQEDTNLRIFEANAQRKYSARMDSIERPPPGPPPNPMFELLRAEYRDVDSSQVGRQFFVAHVLEQRQRNPNRNEKEVLEEAFQQARARLKGEPWSPATRERQKPTAQQKAKFTGTGAGSASSGPPQTQRATITSDENRMAQKLYSHIQDPEERKRLYYKNVKMKGRG